MNPCDLSAIERQRVFINQALDFYNRQLKYQRDALNQLKNRFGSNPDQIMFYEKNIHFIKFLIFQYHQILDSLRQMWQVYSNNPFCSNNWNNWNDGRTFSW